MQILASYWQPLTIFFEMPTKSYQRWEWALMSCYVAEILTCSDIADI